MKKWLRLLRKHKKQLELYFGVAFLLILLVGFFFNVVKASVVILLFLIASVVVRFYKRILIGLPLELEFSIFGTVILTMAYGIWVGLFFAILSSIVAEFFTQYISPFIVINILTYALIPFIAFFVPTENVIVGGYIAMTVTNLIIFSVNFFMGYDLFKNLSFSVTNLIWNYFLFSYLAVPILGVLV